MWIKAIIDFLFGIGMIANAALFIPQAWVIYKSKSAKNLSFATFAGFNFIQIFTALHGFMIKDYLLAGFMGLSFITCGMVTLMIFLYRNK